MDNIQAVIRQGIQKSEPIQKVFKSPCPKFVQGNVLNSHFTSTWANHWSPATDTRGRKHTWIAFLCYVDVSVKSRHLRLCLDINLENQLKCLVFEKGLQNIFFLHAVVFTCCYEDFRFEDAWSKIKRFISFQNTTW